MDKDLETIIRLQELDGEIYHAQKALEAIPDQLKALDDELGTHRSHQDVAKKALEESLKARKAHEQDIKSVEAEISRLKGQQGQIKTNAAYSAMLEEIRLKEASISALEEKILISMDEEERLQNQRRETEAAFGVERVRIERDQAAIRSEAGRLETDLADLTARRADSASAVENDVLERYERILKRAGDGRVVVPLEEGNVCGGCRKTIPAQYAAVVRCNQQILTCDGCSRILYKRVEAPHPAG